MDNPKLLENYRPISLYSCSYKLTTTILVSKLKMFFPKLIAEEQRAYVSASSIYDNILLMQEIRYLISYSTKGIAYGS